MKRSLLKNLAVCFVFAAATQASAAGNGKSEGSAVRPSNAVPTALTSLQSGRPEDPDMGDDHASLTAIEKVCNKDTPAAQHAAICDGGAISRG